MPLNSTKPMASKARTERIKARQEAKTERVKLRTEAKQVAYTNGINPSSGIADLVKNVVNKAGGLLSGFGGLTNTSIEDTYSGTETGNGNVTPVQKISPVTIIIAGIAAVGLLVALMSGKKGKYRW